MQDFDQTDKDISEALEFQDDLLDLELMRVIQRKNFIVPLVKDSESNQMVQEFFINENNQKIILAFTNMNNFLKWNKSARPLILNIEILAKAVVEQKYNAILFDVQTQKSFKLTSLMCRSIYEKSKWVPAYRNQEFRSEIENIINKYPKIDEFNIQYSKECDAKLVFYSKFDISDDVIEISKKIQNLPKIAGFAPDGLDFLVNFSRPDKVEVPITNR